MTEAQRPKPFPYLVSSVHPSSILSLPAPMRNPCIRKRRGSSGFVHLVDRPLGNFEREHFEKLISQTASCPVLDNR